ncbi:hypothetical protein MJO28_007515 [Puccinia striiformis f. sp. tritici]|uniref:Uncharacterized protein n=1 Tax=Puccinia striiformis f. sp. tritici TaxID=168172 RepID=A0ACC0EET4_9BASI|nr:hypothetical protein MJO28_007515 [Puccinia striiformis f. sp. tritici]
MIHQNPRLRLQFSHAPPNCQVLEIQELRTDGAQLLNNDDMVTPPLLEGLLESFGDTIVELDLTFIDILLLPTSTIQTIRRIKNLRTVRLSYERREEETSCDCRHDPAFFCSLLSATQGLKKLVIGSFSSDHFPKILVSHLGRFQLPNIRHLVAEDEDVIELVFSLAVALKSTLTMASKIDLIDNDEEYVPLMFGILQDKLQGLHIYNPDKFAGIPNLNFTSRRLLRIDDCMHDPDLDLSKLDMFTYAPIEILVLSGSDTHKSCSTFVLYQVTRLRSLRKLVFYGVDLTFSAPENYLKACRDHQVECFNRYKPSLEELMVSQ